MARYGALLETMHNYLLVPPPVPEICPAFTTLLLCGCGHSSPLLGFSGAWLIVLPPSHFLCGSQIKMLRWISFISAPLASPTSTSQTTALETLDKIQPCPPMPNLGLRRDSGRGEDSEGRKEEVACGQVKL